MLNAEFKLDEALAILDRTPASLSALLAGVPDRWAHASSGAGDWSPYEVIVHLIHGEDTNWMPRARHILAGEQRPFPPFDRAGAFESSQGTPLDTLLAAFAARRRANLDALAALNLAAADLDRTGLHPEFGEVRLGQLLATWVVHDLNHLAQIVRTMARVYGLAVGPWSAYLDILRDEE
jgi:hypothetical protein